MPNNIFTNNANNNNIKGQIKKAPKSFKGRLQGIDKDSLSLKDIWQYHMEKFEIAPEEEDLMKIFVICFNGRYPSTTKYKGINYEHGFLRINCKNGSFLKTSRFTCLEKRKKAKGIQMSIPKYAEDIFGVDLEDYEDLIPNLNVRIEDDWIWQLGIAELETHQDFVDYLEETPGRFMQLHILYKDNQDNKPKLPKPCDKGMYINLYTNSSRIMGAELVEGRCNAYLKKLDTLRERYSMDKFKEYKAVDNQPLEVECGFDIPEHILKTADSKPPD